MMRRLAGHRQAEWVLAMLLYAATIFLSAFLLFQVQPLIGRFVLPWFGGTPAVWSTCLLFFQLLLLGGYGYAHYIVSRIKPRQQALVHTVLIVASLALLPIAPSEHLKPTGQENPLFLILFLLARTVGLPYLVVSTTGPLVQGWFSQAYPGRSPYRLYALSNVGSLLALLTYPLVFERLYRLRVQAWIWSSAYLVFAVLCIVCAWRAAAVAREAEAQREHELEEPLPALAPGRLVAWLLLAACGTMILMATTNKMCQDVAVVPFLWVLPLGLYLLSFIICFDRERWYVRPLFSSGLALSATLVLLVTLHPNQWTMTKQIICYCSMVFCCCMVCHGELVRLKPEPRRLTLFYFLVSAGGALGGVFVALVAPYAFHGFFELQIALIGAGLLLTMLVARELALPAPEGVSRPALPGQAVALVTGLAVVVAGCIFLANERQRLDGALIAVRNFYGLLRVTEEDVSKPEYRCTTLIHGRINHGFQMAAPDWHSKVVSYFGPTTGICQALTQHPGRFQGQGSIRIGVAGLGTGSIAGYGRQGDTLRFYEINPLVETLCRRYFTYLQDASARGADVSVHIGDARILLEREASQHFDALAADAFSSDAVPVHLLTKQANEVYWKHLKPDGILCMNITNTFIDLSPVINQMADTMGKQVLYFDDTGDWENKRTCSTWWALITSNQEFLHNPEVLKHTSKRPNVKPLPWSDDFSNLFDVIKK